LAEDDSANVKHELESKWHGSEVETGGNICTAEADERQSAGVTTVEDTGNGTYVAHRSVQSDVPGRASL